MDTFEKNKTLERERNPENAKESNKERKLSPEAKAAATRERAELLVKEVKSSKQQIQNIMLNVNQVLQAIKALRAQLQLATNDGDSISSVEQDKKSIEKLKKKIAGHTDELFKIKEELIVAHANQMAESQGIILTDELKEKAKNMVENLLAEISS